MISTKLFEKFGKNHKSEPENLFHILYDSINDNLQLFNHFTFVTYKTLLKI